MIKSDIFVGILSDNCYCCAFSAIKYRKDDVRNENYKDKYYYGELYYLRYILHFSAFLLCRGFLNPLLFPTCFTAAVNPTVQIPLPLRTPPKSAGRGARLLFQQAETKLRQLRCRSPVPLSAGQGACAPRTILPPAALAGH